MKSYYVYVHSRLSTGAPFYVGKGRGSRVFNCSGRSDHWKRVVKKDGGRYANVVFETPDEELAFLVEIELIDKYRRHGAALINKTDGGEGMSGYRMTPEQRANQSRAKRGHKFNVGRKDTEESRANKRAAQQARAAAGGFAKLSDAHKQKIAEGLSKPETKERMRLASLGKKASAETRAKLSAIHKGRQHTLGHKLTEEHKAKLAVINSNRSQEERDEISRKLSIAAKADWQRRKAASVSSD